MAADFVGMDGLVGMILPSSRANRKGNDGSAGTEIVDTGGPSLFPSTKAGVLDWNVEAGR